MVSQRPLNTCPGDLLRLRFFVEYSLGHEFFECHAKGPERIKCLVLVYPSQILACFLELVSNGRVTANSRPLEAVLQSRVSVVVGERMRDFREHAGRYQVSRRHLTVTLSHGRPLLPAVRLCYPPWGAGGCPSTSQGTRPTTSSSTGTWSILNRSSREDEPRRRPKNAFLHPHLIG